jgi:hypothetical protein
MEHGRYGLNSPILTGNQYDSLAVLPNTKSRIDPEKAAQHLLFNEATRLAGDWLEATDGQDITQQQYDSLFENGYVSHSSEAVSEIFYDWEDYQLVARDFLLDRRKQKSLKDSTLIEQARAEISDELLPEMLLRNSERYTTKNKRKGGKPLVRYRFTDEEAPSEVILERYARYILADYLLHDRPSGKEVTEERMIGIALGFSYKSNKPLSSFLGSLKNSHPFLTDNDVERAAEEFGLYDYLYPKSHQDHLREIRKVGGIKTQRKVGALSIKSAVESIDPVER